MPGPKKAIIKIPISCKGPSEEVTLGISLGIS